MNGPDSMMLGCGLFLPHCFGFGIRLKCIYVLGVVKRNPLFLHEIEWTNNGFLFTTPNI